MKSKKDKRPRICDDKSLPVNLQNWRLLEVKDTELSVWEERDRLHIRLIQVNNNKTLAEWWDEDAREMFTDGFFESRDLHGSVFDYCRGIGMI